MDGALLITMFSGRERVDAPLQHSPAGTRDSYFTDRAHSLRGPLGWFYYVVQATTAAILVLAANTSYAGFPRLASLLARDRFLPRQLANLGDRLVFSNGIVLLAVFRGCWFGLSAETPAG